MVVKTKIKSNTIEVQNYLKKLEKKLPRAIEESLNRVSAYGVKRITEKTQKGITPDGGRFQPYAQSTKKIDKKEDDKFLS